ncbi:MULTISPECIES: single-stranded DNA-binding protein [Alphaproteobacteria]|jgi:single-strand DNA-binding protein|uniref:single-stranded DNA-binding protein n=1 Tax=Alphaproteobacteria TaxID=28211 RepID=UPI00224C739B|nr:MULTISPECIES: single-stranded DNA-binding protein [Alphaproteobacteria]CAH1666906.1 Single-stranded DNA-binding protein [Chelatococcus asaccharovorans]CAH1681263.1 Single-stranded DNA-binding protein [Chelatococcus asaccharovorans]HMR30114.1 single-stranded DNA-binding protein [Geminicoccus sp.]HMT99467.1 single-stranded DNA-binding protein [Amaricoccus sp.]
MFNQVTLVGHIGANPEIRNTSNGNKVANFSLATSRPRYSDGKIVRNERGYAEQDTEWHRIVAFNGQAKSAEKCVKGMLVLIIGRNRTNKWQDRDGNDRYTTEVVAEEIRFLAWPKREDEQTSETFDDDIPF